MLRRVGRALALLASLATAGAAEATECRPANGTSPCIDADSLWLATGAAHLLTLPEPVALEPGQVGLALAVQLLERVLTVDLPSPVPEGREVRLVDQVITEQLLLAAGLGHHFELGLSLSVVLRQSGTGSAGITSQRGDPLDPTATRDPRVSLAYAAALTPSLGVKPRLELALPLGNKSAYASAGSVVLAPALPIQWRLGPFAASAELALRLKQSVELGSLRWGSQAVTALGLSLEVLPRELVEIGAELMLLPSLGNASSARGAALGVETSLLPAEWLLSVRSRPRTDEPWTLALAAGAALALSSQSSATGEQRFVAPTGPGLRLLAEVRYTPRD
jgi:OOP family OmpA-OmpF porin